MLPKTPAIMLQGTSSDAGKSLLCTALCRIFSRKGLHVFPFKAQNMSSHLSYINKKHMGCAQIMQAIAAHQSPFPAMNPVLLCPNGKNASDIYLLGQHLGSMSYKDYIKQKKEFFQTIQEAYAQLAQKADLMLIEGAGSPAEINLQAHDIVNMRIAHMAHAKVWLVGDIDRGGVFAHLYGTYALLSSKDKKRIKGFILNKFRGDDSLLISAKEIITQKTQIPFLATVPYMKDHGLPEEDSLSFSEGKASVTLPVELKSLKNLVPSAQDKSQSPQEALASSARAEKRSTNLSTKAKTKEEEFLYQHYDGIIEQIADTTEEAFPPHFFTKLSQKLLKKKRLRDV